MCLSNTDVGSYLGTSQIYNFQTNQAQVDLSNVDIILFVGCETAKHDNTSLTDAAVAAGANFAIGFTKKISCTGANKYVESFFKYLSDGFPVEVACTKAKNENSSHQGISSCTLDHNN